MSRRPRGVALIVVMLVMFLAVYLGAEVMERLERDRTRTMSLLLQEQGYAYLLGAESLGMKALAADKASDRDGGGEIDDCTEKEWAVALGPLPWDNGVFEVSIQDLQGRYNLNNLARTNDTGRVLDRVEVERFKRLLRATLPAPEAADALAEEAADWTDSNTLVDGLGGAEDTEYDLWRTGNAPFADVSELRALGSATGEQWREAGARPLFSRYITALPEGTRINVNTAPPTLLAALTAGMDSARAGAIRTARERRPFTSVEEVLALPEIGALPEGERNELKSALVVASEYFQVVSKVTLGERVFRLVSVVYRPAHSGAPRVVQRNLGETFTTPEGACNPEWTGMDEGSTP